MSGSFVVSSVDTTANTFTATGVAAAGQPEGSVLFTGDRFRLRNVGGALPAATPSLAGATDYWARRVSDDSIQAYDSNAHALAGGSTGLVDITGGLGAGVTTIEFGLPYCLPTVNAAQGIQLRPFTVADTWSGLVALYTLLTGQAQAIWSAITVAVATTFSALVMSGTVSTTGSITPSAISGTTLNYAPAGLSTCSVIRLSSTAGTDSLSGLAGGTDGREITIYNIGSTSFLVLHEDVNSSAANRFTLVNGASFTVRTGGAVVLRYDGTSSRWRVAAYNI